MAQENTVHKLLTDLSSKTDITEIIINSPKSIYVERLGVFEKLSYQTTVEDVKLFAKDIAKLNNKEINSAIPILDGNLADGSRINIIMDPYASGCPAITIRKYLKNIKRFDANPGIFGLTPKWTKFLKVLIASRMNLIVSGGTGVGKTTFMNLLMQEMNPDERVITIEDTKELNFDLPNVVRLEARLNTTPEMASISIRDLVKNTLRMRPDRIVIGEARGGELFDLLQAMNTGHEGSFTSIHANTPSECLSRVENLFLLAGYDVPIKAIRYQVATAVDFIIQVGRLKDGTRVLKQISEITGMEGDKILLSDLMKADDKGKLKGTGLASKRLDELLDAGLDTDFFSQKD